MMNSGTPNSGMQAGQQLQGIDPSVLQNDPQQLPNNLGLDGPDQSEQSAKPTDKLRAYVEGKNIAEDLDEDKLKTIGSEAKEGFDNDKLSRQEWENAIDEWVKLASQHRERKTWPWDGASNVKYPLLTTAAMQFAARAYPSLLPSDGKIVKNQVIGKDQDGSKAEQADRVSTYMSYQLMHEVEGWEESMDKLLIQLPIVGTIFKKTYWDSVKKTIASEIILPKNLVVNYWAKSLCDAERVSQVIEMSPRILKERQMSKVFLDIDLGDAPMPADAKNAPEVDNTTPYTLVEQHCFLDLDDDDYAEPYIVTFHLETGKVLRIVARYDESGLIYDDEGNLQKIEPIQYFTKFGFVPNPDGSFYDIGFGVLLGPVNESVNTLINQLIDAGTLNNMQSGFLGKGLRVRLGETRFLPGEWKAVNSMGQDLKQQIVPLPTKEPSAVLFQLMGSLITSGKELASVAEIFVGKMPGQNTPATTTMATIEQGMKVFTAVYKRLYRSLAEEFSKVFDLDNTYLNPNTYQQVLGITVGPADFDKKQFKIVPGADPTAVSQTEKLVKAQGLQELLPTGVLDPVKVVLRILDAQEQPNIQELLNQTVAQTGQLPQQPNPKVMESQAKVQAMQQLSAIKAQEQEQKMQYNAADAQTKLAMKQQMADLEARSKAIMLSLETAIKTHAENMKVATDKMAAMQQMIMDQQQHHQKMRHAEEMAAVKRKQAQIPKGNKN
jgi:chaperonin GroES